MVERLAFVQIGLEADVMKPVLSVRDGLVLVGGSIELLESSSSTGVDDGDPFLQETRHQKEAARFQLVVVDEVQAQTLLIRCQDQWESVSVA
ncbi:MAG: hypothetical protein ACE5F1_19930, partial [Planctomycetota bacterium]